MEPEGRTAEVSDGVGVEALLEVLPWRVGGRLFDFELIF